MSLIAGLKWSDTIGSGHGPLLQIQGNENAKELIRIGKPAVPLLVQALTPVPDNNPLAKRRHVVVVKILGEIADPRAVVEIVKAMDAQWKDAVFLEAATSSLQKIGDPTAVPALVNVGDLSLRLYAASQFPKEQPAEIPADAGDSRLQWWIKRQHISDVNMASLWLDAFSAIGTIAPEVAMQTAQVRRRGKGKLDLLAASTLARSAALKDARHLNEAIAICNQANSDAANLPHKEWVTEFLRELKKQ